METQHSSPSLSFKDDRAAEREKIIMEVHTASHKIWANYVISQHMSDFSSDLNSENWSSALNSSEAWESIAPSPTPPSKSDESDTSSETSDIRLPVRGSRFVLHRILVLSRELHRVSSYGLETVKKRGCYLGTSRGARDWIHHIIL